MNGVNIQPTQTPPAEQILKPKIRKLRPHPKWKLVVMMVVIAAVFVIVYYVFNLSF